MRLGQIACRHDLIILSDEIWSDIVYQAASLYQHRFAGRRISDRTVTITGFSKSYGLAGLRIGAVMASNRNHYNRLYEASLHQSTVHGANLLSQVAAIAALEHCGQWLDEFVIHLQAMRDHCVGRLNAIPGFACIPPEGCYVAFADITGTGRSSAEIRDLLFDQAKVAVVPGLPEWFGPGAAGYIRLSFATSKAILDEALDRITLTIRNLKPPTPEPMKYVIIGGGIAGLAIGAFLQRNGKDVIVSEKQPHASAHGHAFLLHDDAVSILRQLNLDHNRKMPGERISLFSL